MHLVRSALPIAFALSVLRCGGGGAEDVEATDPRALTWVAPSPTDTVETNEPITLTVRTDNMSAASVHFRVDGTESAHCDRTDEDCFDEGTFTTTVSFANAGSHRVEAFFTDGTGAQVAAQLDLAVQPASSADPMTYALESPDENTSGDSQTETNVATEAIVGPRGFLDPNRGYHSVCHGQTWRMYEQRVGLEHGRDDGSVPEIRRCIARYGTLIDQYADANHVSRASLTAALAVAGNCGDTPGWQRNIVSGAVCATLNPGMTAAQCTSAMRTDVNLAISTAARYLGTHHARRVHRHDAPRIAAYLNRGTVRCGHSNPWHMFSSHGYITHFVEAYNAYRFWEADRYDVPVCDKHVTVTVALYNWMPTPHTNGCWNVEKVSKGNADWRICNYDGTRYHASAPNWAYDDTNGTHSGSQESSMIARCARNATGNGYVYMANRDGQWHRVDPGVRVSDFFAELYSSEFTVDDQFDQWARDTHVGAPMVNVGHAPESVIHGAVERACDAIHDHARVGLYTSTALDGSRLDSVVSALDRCTLR